MLDCQGRQGNEKEIFQIFYCWECFPSPGEDFGWASRWYSDLDVASDEATPLAQCPYKLEDDVDNLDAVAVDIVPFLSVPAKFSQENPIPAEIYNEIVSEDKGCLWAVYSFTKGLYLEDEMKPGTFGYGAALLSIMIPSIYRGLRLPPDEFQSLLRLD